MAVLGLYCLMRAAMAKSLIGRYGRFLDAAFMRVLPSRYGNESSCDNNMLYEFLRAA
jgi:hypothetical protein